MVFYRQLGTSETEYWKTWYAATGDIEDKIQVNFNILYCHNCMKGVQGI